MEKKKIKKQPDFQNPKQTKSPYIFFPFEVAVENEAVLVFYILCMQITSYPQTLQHMLKTLKVCVCECHLLQNRSRLEQLVLSECITDTNV